MLSGEQSFVSLLVRATWETGIPPSLLCPWFGAVAFFGLRLGIRRRSRLLRSRSRQDETQTVLGWTLKDLHTASTGTETGRRGEVCLEKCCKAT